MKFRHDFLTQSQLGELFGVSSHDIGRWLVELGLRNDRKKPTKAAFDGGYANKHGVIDRLATKQKAPE